MPQNRPLLNCLTPAELLLVELCRDDGPHLDRIPKLHVVDAGRLYHDLLAGAIRHGVQGLVFSTLQKSPAGMELLAEHREQIRDSLSLITRQATFWDLEQDRVLGGMRRAGFQPLVLKGGALRRWVYNAPVERVMGDFDILVTPDEVPQVMSVLRGLGYENEYSERVREALRTHLYHDGVVHPNGFHVEVHWGLTRPGGPVHLDPALFLERSHILKRPGTSGLRVPSAEDMIVHTVAQSHQDGIRRLRRLVDLDRVIGSQQLDWDYVIKQAEEANLYTSLCITHRATELLLGTSIPDELLEGRGLSRMSKKAIASMRPVPRLLGEPRWAWLADDLNLLHLWCLPGWRERGRSLRRRASGVHDPLEWVWEDSDHPEREPVRNRGVRVAAKMLAQQAVVVLSYIWKLLMPAGRIGVRFWKNEV